MQIKILGSTWFTAQACIGIVLINNGYEDKSYIGIGNGVNQASDEELIAESGTPFPVEIAKKMILGVFE